MCICLNKIICMILSVVTILNLMSVNVLAQENNRCIIYVLIEAQNKTVIDGDNEYVKVPVGVMSKLMTIYIVAEQIENGQLSVDEILKTSTYANSMQGAQIWLMPGEEITVDELLKAVIIGNANDASVVLAEKISGTEEKFVKLMNERTDQLGMMNTTFTNCNGYYDDNEQTSTAYDLAILCAALARYDFLNNYFTCWRDYVRNGQTELVNSNELVKTYKGIIGFKTGYTDSSGYMAAIAAERNGTVYISVVLGHDEKEDSVSQAKSLLDVAFSQYTVVIPELPDDIPDKISVKGGMSKTVPLGYGKVKSVVLPNWAIESIKSSVVITDYVYSPVPAGFKVGEIQFVKSDKLMFCVDIVTKENIEEINVSKALNIIVKKLLTF